MIILNELEQETKDIIKDWRNQAKEQTLKTLPKFLNHLMNDYSHDYGTICHAMSIGAIATKWAMDKEKQGGILGFQASAIMWEDIKHWMNYNGPLKLLNFENMLYPQYEENFDKTITKDAFDWLKNKAKHLLEDKKSMTNKRVIEHWESIANGKVPFGYKVET